MKRRQLYPAEYWKLSPSEQKEYEGKGVMVHKTEASRAVLRAQLIAMTEKRDALLEALGEYGEHHKGCPARGDLVAEECTCGFAEALRRK